MNDNIEHQNEARVTHASLPRNQTQQGSDLNPSLQEHENVLRVQDVPRQSKLNQGANIDPTTTLESQSHSLSPSESSHTEGLPNKSWVPWIIGALVVTVYSIGPINLFMTSVYLFIFLAAYVLIVFLIVILLLFIGCLVELRLFFFWLSV